MASALLASMGMGAEARKKERQTYAVSKSFDGRDLGSKSSSRGSREESKGGESKKAESKWDENSDPQSATNAYRSLSFKEKQQLETLSTFSKKISKTGPAEKVVVKFGDKIKLHVNFQMMTREILESSIRWEKIKENDHIQFIEFVVDLLPDFETVDAKNWDTFVVRLEVTYFPKNKMCSATHVGKCETRTMQIDETQSVDAFVKDMGVEFLGLSDTHSVSIDDFDKPVCINMRAEFIKRLSQFELSAK
jgi:hypothetical protein